jgi:hypothetical protein
LDEDEGLIHNLFMTDEAHFHLSGFVNKQNFHDWSNVNPQQLHQKPLHSTRVTVWYGILSFGITGPYFFEDNNEITTAVTSAHYVHMIETFFTQELNQFPQFNKSTWFQQYRATSHTARNSIDTVNQMLPNHIIFKNWGHFLASEVA